MAAPLPTPVPTWHNDTYAAIDPNNQTLSQAGKTIIITGAGTGVGRATALAFAQAKARHIILIGRTERTLRETESIILKELQEPPEITIFPASVSSPTQINTLASTISSSGNGWDVLILNAATVGDPPGSSVLTMDMSSFWEVYETNLLSIFLITQALFPLANTGACALNVGAAGSVLPSRLSPGIGTYASSKIAAAKLVEFLAFENPTIFLCTVHPGIIMTPMLEKSGLDKDKLPLDSVELPAHFLLWLAQQKRDGEKERKAEFLRGKFLWANWDVEELVQKTEEIRQSEENTVGLVGFPYGQKLSV